jgi:hypothetical protein
LIASRGRGFLPPDANEKADRTTQVRDAALSAISQSEDENKCRRWCGVMQTKKTDPPSTGRCFT